jgi:hypothetical protein
MNQFGTDVLAMLVIAGGAGVGGASTLLFSETSHDFEYACSVAVQSPTTVVVTLGDEDGSVVAIPDVQVQVEDECSARFELHELTVEAALHGTERALERAERARERAERVQERAERVRERAQRGVRVERIHIEGVEDLDFDFDFDFDSDADFDFEGLEAQMEGLDLQLQGLEGLEFQLQGLEGLEFRMDGMSQELDAEIEQRLEEELRQLEEKLSRLNGGVGR